ncbi:hypothetical protein [uncultured Rhodospira sp.]|uniref:hypothetical protein n=1 Tax=uncultured Rhodospira sp. TaxID=1936189 RepID=UPI002637E3C6|nr:hypothetical protein [uncultured Rhodospira sp.]
MLRARFATAIVALAVLLMAGGAGPAQATDASPAPVLTTTASPAPALSTPIETDGPGFETARACCKICHKGKACGDSCINRAYTCHRPPGCACNGY